MQKIILFILILVVWTGVQAQRIIGKTPKFSMTSNARTLDQLPNGLIYYEGFDNVNIPNLPTGWTTFSISNTAFVSGSAGDEIGQCNSNGYWPVPLHGLFVFTNDDACTGCDKSADRLTSPTIDLSSYKHLTIGFSAFQNGSGGQTAVLQFKSAGGAWADIFQIPSSALWENYRISVPSAYLHKSFQLRFRFNDNATYASGLAIDDLYISNESSGEFELQEFYAVKGTEAASGYLYNSIPLTQAREADLVFGAKVSNQDSTIKNAILQVVVNGPINFNDSSSQWLVASNQIRAIKYDNRNKFTPYKRGEYQLDATLLTDSVDESTNDNFFATSFNVTDSIYKRIPDNTDGSGIVISNPNDRAGSVFNMFKKDTVKAVYVHIHEATAQGARFRIKFFDYNTLTSSIYSSNTVEVGEAEIGKIKRIKINHEFSIGKYLVIIEKETGTLVVNTTTKESSPFGVSFYQKAGQAWSHLAYYPMIRLILPAVDSNCAGHIQCQVTDETCYGNHDGVIVAEAKSANFPWTYNWSTGAGNSNAISNLSPGQYELIVSDGNGCIYNKSFQIESGSTFQFSALITPDSCGKNVGVIQTGFIDAIEPVNYFWDSQLGINEKFKLSSGYHSLSLIDDHGCAFDTSLKVNGTDPLYVPVAINRSGCGESNGSIVATPIGTSPFSFSWSMGGIDDTVTGLESGIYLLTVSDSIGCESRVTIYLRDSNSADINLQQKSNVSCYGLADGQIQLTASGGTNPLAYSWSNGGTASNITNLTASSYTVTVTDNNNCRNFLVVKIDDESKKINLHLMEKGIYCYGAKDGSLKVLVDGGSAPYDFSWSNGKSSQEQIGLGHGEYAVTVTDDKGCVATALTELFEQPIMFYTLDSISKTHVDSLLTGGSIFISTYGGTPPYTYIWSNGWKKEDLLAADTGTNYLTITDQLRCSLIEDFQITEYPLEIPLINSSEDLRIFPNPTHTADLVYFKSHNPIGSASIIDLNGKLIRYVDLNQINYFTAPTLSGVYILIINKPSSRDKYIKLMVID